MLNPNDARRAVYRRGSTPGQVDHPGWLSKVVESASALEDALADGWQLEMTDAAAPTPENSEETGDKPEKKPHRKSWGHK